jgi:hypothetical protein
MTIHRLMAAIATEQVVLRDGEPHETPDDRSDAAAEHH